MGRDPHGGRTASPMLEVIDDYVVLAPIDGDVIVRNGGSFVLRSVLRGSLTVRRGGAAIVVGRVDEDVEVHRGGRLVIVGVVLGGVRDRGGQLIIDTRAYVPAVPAESADVR